MEVYLIRHTKTDITPGLIYGRTDVPLAGSFAAEMAVIRPKLPANFDAVYSSPSRRCVQLAEQIASAITTDERIYELNFGKWEGQTWDTIDRQASELWMQDFVNNAPPDGETLVQMQSRVQAFWNELRQQPHERVAVVTHGGVIRLLLATEWQLPLTSLFEIRVEYGDVFVIVVSGQEPDTTMTNTD
ncbi:alpha-ribazole phosphatase [Spirosoma rhododendri]|uniref:Alpha-ribazole phosphatase n=1 Tax=Spirosoma rhododendri TaxID=2728024 RepID=A0A7L5DVR7_9BACT|nr:alpha-ribazole phosphatase [Spirosoma rhododendri]QJD79640.1 alpha-ribazole phosphatase [Spirosoma rhododendri]